MSSTGGGVGGTGFAAGLAARFVDGFAVGDTGFFFAVAAGFGAGFVSAAVAANASTLAARQATRDRARGREPIMAVIVLSAWGFGRRQPRA